MCHAVHVILWMMAMFYVDRTLSHNIAAELAADMAERLTTNSMQWALLLTRPVPNPAAPDTEVQVVVRFHNQLKKVLSYDSKTQVLTTLFLQSLAWDSHHMTWIPEDYNGLEHFTYPKNRVWTPQLFLLNALSVKEDHSLGDYVTVYYNGTITLSELFVYKTTCNSYHWEFPYDHIDCSLTWGSESFSIERLAILVTSLVNGNEDLRDDHGAMELLNYQGKDAWEILDFFANVSSSTVKEHAFQTVEYIFHLHRQSNVYDRLLVYPGVLLALFSIFIFCIPLPAPDRSNLGVVVVTGFIIILLIVIITGTNTGNSKLGIFYYINLILVLSALTLSSLLLTLYSKESEMTCKLRKIFVYDLGRCVKVYHHFEREMKNAQLFDLNDPENFFYYKSKVVEETEMEEDSTRHAITSVIKEEEEEEEEEDEQYSKDDVQKLKDDEGETAEELNGSTEDDMAEVDDSKSSEKIKSNIQSAVRSVSSYGNVLDTLTQLCCGKCKTNDSSERLSKYGDSVRSINLVAEDSDASNASAKSAVSVNENLDASQTEALSNLKRKVKLKSAGSVKQKGQVAESVHSKTVTSSKHSYISDISDHTSLIHVAAEPESKSKDIAKNKVSELHAGVNTKLGKADIHCKSVTGSTSSSHDNISNISAVLVNTPEKNSDTAKVTTDSSRNTNDNATLNINSNAIGQTGSIHSKGSKGSKSSRSSAKSQGIALVSASARIRGAGAKRPAGALSGSSSRQGPSSSSSRQGPGGMGSRQGLASSGSRSGPASFGSRSAGLSSSGSRTQGIGSTSKLAGLASSGSRSQAASGSLSLLARPASGSSKALTGSSSRSNARSGSLSMLQAALGSSSKGLLSSSSRTHGTSAGSNSRIAESRSRSIAGSSKHGYDKAYLGDLIDGDFCMRPTSNRFQRDSVAPLNRKEHRSRSHHGSYHGAQPGGLLQMITEESLTVFRVWHHNHLWNWRKVTLVCPKYPPTGEAVWKISVNEQ